MTDFPDRPVGPDLVLLSQLCCRAIVKGDRLDDVLARMDPGLDTFFPAPREGALREDPDLRRRMLRILMRGIWSQTPHPDADYALPKLSEPGRNEPCHCGSGRKYKQCCQRLARQLPIDGVNFLPALLEALPRKHWKALADSRVDRERVMDTVQQWQDQDEQEAVVALLEPWFAKGRTIRARDEFLFDSLLDAYSELGNPRKKTRLLEHGIENGERAIQSAALQRKSSILADRGKFEEAWALFEKAQRIEPDAPGLAHLEVVILFQQGREDEARRRADFWARRLARSGMPELSDLAELLRDVARRGSAAIAETMSEHVGGGKLVSVVQNAPAPAVLYSLDPVDGNAGPLMPKPRLARALKAWQDAIETTDYFPGADRLPSDPAEKLGRMVTLLGDHPVLWQSFEVLADLAYAARELDILGIDENVILPLLQRAEVLIDAVLSESGAEACCLEWGFWVNRPALDLLAWRIGMDLDKPATPDHLRRLERLLALNPNDNQGMRMPLSRRYLEAGRFDDAIELAERYPDDFPEMQYNHALALYALGQHEQASPIMAAAVKDYPKILEALLKPRIRRPAINPSAVSIGGHDEAWLYRESYRPIWQRLDALAWAKRFRS